MSMRVFLVLTIIWTIAMLLAGAFMHWKLTASPAVMERETFKPQVIQKDGSVISARVPADAVPAAPHAIPTGSKEERRVSVTIQPAKHPDKTFLPDINGKCHAEQVVCPAITVDLSVVRNAGGDRDVIASSKDGTVIESINIPIGDAGYYQTKKLALSANYASNDRYSLSLVKQFNVMGVPVSAGAGIFHFDGEAVPALSVLVPIF